jgi:hypothetical protein
MNVICGDEGRWCAVMSKPYPISFHGYKEHLLSAQQWVVHQGGGL